MLAILLLLAVLVSMPLSFAAGFVLIFLVFPVVTLVAAQCAVRGRAAQLCAWLGGISYAIYVIHQPMSVLFEAALRRLVGHGVTIAPAAGWGALALLVGTSWLLDRVYDRPVRRWLIRFTDPKSGHRTRL